MLSRGQDNPLILIMPMVMLSRGENDVDDENDVDYE